MCGRRQSRPARARQGSSHRQGEVGRRRRANDGLPGRTQSARHGRKNGERARPGSTGRQAWWRPARCGARRPPGPQEAGVEGGGGGRRGGPGSCGAPRAGTVTRPTDPGYCAGEARRAAGLRTAGETPHTRAAARGRAGPVGIRAYVVCVGLTSQATSGLGGSAAQATAFGAKGACGKWAGACAGAGCGRESREVDPVIPLPGQGRGCEAKNSQTASHMKLSAPSRPQSWVQSHWH
jgi:hypothetical protein